MGGARVGDAQCMAAAWARQASGACMARMAGGHAQTSMRLRARRMHGAARAPHAHLVRQNAATQPALLLCGPIEVGGVELSGCRAKATALRPGAPGRSLPAAASSGAPQAARAGQGASGARRERGGSRKHPRRAAHLLDPPRQELLLERQEGLSSLGGAGVDQSIRRQQAFLAQPAKRATPPQHPTARQSAARPITSAQHGAARRAPNAPSAALGEAPSTPPR